MESLELLRHYALTGCNKHEISLIHKDHEVQEVDIILQNGIWGGGKFPT